MATTTAKKAKPAEGTRVRIGPGRLSFVQLIEPKENDSGQLKYSCNLLLPPGYDTQPILDALTAAAVEAWGKDRAKWPKGARKPSDVIKDAGEKEYDGYEEGWSYITCTSDEAPQIVDAMRQEVTDPKQVYSGRWANVSCNAFSYKNKTTGVSLGLGNVQLLRNDSVFGRTSAKNDFDDEVEEMEEEGSFE